MSFKQTATFIGLMGVGVWLLGAAPVQARGASASSGVESPGVQMGTGNLKNCSFRGIKLAGKVQVVDSFPDIRIKAVKRFPDLKVKRVESFADDCGEWQMVDGLADFKVQFVDSYPDIEVAWVEGHPGEPSH